MLYFGMTAAYLVPVQMTEAAIGTDDEQTAVMKKQLQDDIAHVASESRFTTKQYARAVAYVRAKAEEVGLRVEEEQVSGILPWERGDSDLCELLLAGGTKMPLHIVALANSEKGELTREVVLVNYFFEQNQGPPPKPFNGRIVFFSRKLEQDRSLKGYEKAVVQRNHGASWAAKYGASAVLVRSVQTGDGPIHGGAVTYSDDQSNSDEKSKPPHIPAAALTVQDAQKLDDLFANPKMRGTVVVHLRIAPKEVERRQSNLLIRVPGTTRSKEIVVLGAHLDSHDTTPGAADDAAGVASVLAVMREFARNRPTRTIFFVLFADEEVNFSGGKEFAKAHKEELSNAVAAIEMDDGDGSPRALQITSIDAQADSELAVASLRQVADYVGKEANGLELHSDSGAYGTDLESLWNDYKIPEVAILQDLTTYFNRHHAENDEPRNIDIDGLERTTLLLMKIMQGLASGTVTPYHPRPKQ
jgi:hypothetical protein